MGVFLLWHLFLHTVPSSQIRSSHPQKKSESDRSKRNGRTQVVKAKTMTVTVLLALAPICFAQEKTPPITIDCTFKSMEFGRLNLPGYSKTKVAPEKIVFLLPGADPGDGSRAREYVVLGRGMGHVTKQADWRELGAKLRKVASDHMANAISYEFSGTEFHVQFLRIRDDILNAGLRQNDKKRSQ